MKKLFFLLPLVLISACTSKPAEEAKTTTAAPATEARATIVISLTSEQIRGAGIVLGHPENRAMHKSVRLNGRVEAGPNSRALVAAPMGGIIREIRVHPTENVRKGQVLAVLEHPDFLKLQENYLISRQDVAFLETEYKRQQTLVAEKAGVEKALQRAEADMKSEQARVSSLEAQLRLLGLDPVKIAASNTVEPAISVKSPIDGQVGEITATLGGFAQAGTALFSLLSRNHLHLELMAYEHDLVGLKVGQAISFSPINAPNEAGRARVFGFSNEIDPATKTVMVHAEVVSPTAICVPGMGVQGVVAVGSVLVLAVPEESIVLTEGGSVVFFTANGKDFVPVPVQTGATVEGYTEVGFAGAMPTGQIATKGGFFIHAHKDVGKGEE